MGSWGGGEGVVGEEERPCLRMLARRLTRAAEFEVSAGTAFLSGWCDRRDGRDVGRGVRGFGAGAGAEVLEVFEASSAASTAMAAHASTCNPVKSAISLGKASWYVSASRR